MKIHGKISRNSKFCVYKKISLEFCILHLLNCINFKKNYKKSIEVLQMSKKLAQEVLSYLELVNYEYRRANPSPKTLCMKL